MQAPQLSTSLTVHTSPDRGPGPGQPFLLPARVPNRTSGELTAATKALLDFRLQSRGIYKSALDQGWWAGSWTIYDHDEIDHFESGWWSPLWKPDGRELFNGEKGKRVLTWKNSNSSADPHDTWANYISGFKPVMLPKRGIFDPVRRGQGKINIVEGKADFLSMLAAGISNTVGIFGSSFVPSDLGKQLESWGVRFLRVFFHPDDGGAKLAQRVSDCAASLLECHFYALPKRNGEKRDVNNLWTGSDANTQIFRESLSHLTDYRIQPRQLKPWTATAPLPSHIPASRLTAYGLGVLRITTSELSLVTNCRNDALNAAAFKLGTFVGAGALEEAAVEHDLISIGVGLGLSVYSTTATVRSGLAAGLLHPADLSHLEPTKERNVIAMTTKPRTAVDKKIKALETPPKPKDTLNGRSDLWVDIDTAREMYLANRYVQPRKYPGEL